MALTITEALAELKTIQKRVEKKREFVGGVLARQEGFRDPLEKDGGSAKVIAQERQAIADLERRHIAIRMAIQKVNQETPVTVDGETKMLAEWLTWRKEVAPGEQMFINKMRATLTNLRAQMQQKGFQVLSASDTARNSTDLIINVDEAELAKQAERLETILGGLDGQLSLKNATVLVAV